MNYRPDMNAQRSKVARWSALAVLLCVTSCASVSFERETATSGTFVSTGWAFTILSIDVPKPAINIARENVSDANLANTVVQERRITPNLGPFDWLLDIISIRRAQIRGTWGFSGE